MDAGDDMVYFVVVATPGPSIEIVLWTRTGRLFAPAQMVLSQHKDADLQWKSVSHATIMASYIGRRGV